MQMNFPSNMSPSNIIACVIFLVFIFNNAFSTTSSEALQLLNEATDHFHASEFDEAIKKVEQILNDPNLPDTSKTRMYITYANCQARKGKFKEAKVNYYNTVKWGTKYDNHWLVFCASDALSLIYKYSGKRDSVFHHYQIMKERGWKSGRMQSYAHALRSIGSFNLTNRDYKEARINLERALFILDSINVEEGINIYLSYLSDLESLENQPVLAASYLLRGIQHLRDKKDSASIVVDLCKLSNVMSKQGDYDQARKYANEALEIAHLKNYEISRGYAYEALARISSSLKAYPEAIDYYKKAYDIFVPRNIAPSSSYSALELGDVYMETGDLEQAQQVIEVALEQAEKSNDEYVNFRCRLALTKYHMKKKQWTTAKNIALKVVEENKAFNFTQIDIIAYSQLAEIMHQLGNDSEAFAYQTTRFRLRDSIFSRENNRTVKVLEGRFNKAQNEKQIAELKVENTNVALEAANARRLRSIFAISALFIALLAAGLFYFLRQKSKSNSLLEEKNTIISAALSEKELLLKEIHHRVKNNLQTISSLLNLQARSLNDKQAAAAIKDGQSRVRSMALIHQNLYQDDNLTGVEAPEYIEKLVNNLSRTYQLSGSPIELKQDIDPLMLDVDTVIPIGLILNELLINAFKYAFDEGESGEILIKLKQQEESLLLMVADNGRGGEAVANENSTSFGYRLVNALAKKLDAEVDIQQEKGTIVSLRIQNFKLAS